MIGPIKLLGKGTYFLKRLVFRYWWVLATIIVLIPMLIVSINQGIEEQDMRIPLKEMGTILISSDQAIYEVTQDLEFESQKKESLGEKVDYYANFVWYLIKNLWEHIWMLFFNFFLFYKTFLFFSGDVSKRLRATILSVGTVAFLELLVFGVPFKGVYALTKFIIGAMGT